MDKIIESLVNDFADQHGLDSLTIDKRFERFSTYCVVSARGAEESFNPEDITVEGAEFGIDGLAVQVNGRIVTDPEEVEVSQNRTAISRFCSSSSRQRRQRDSRRPPQSSWGGPSRSDNPVNARMAETVEGADRSRFPVLNNGVTVIAREVQTVGDDVIVRDYQIVNGCQTANVIHAHRGQSLQQGFWVPLKVVATDDDDLITEIVTATNSQTAVRPEELSSRSRFERTLERYFEAVGSDRDADRKGLRYERRSRQYVGDAAVAAARVIPRRILVRSYVSFALDQPHRATGYVTSLLKQMGTEHFVDGHRPEPYYTAAHAYYRLDNMFNSGRVDGKYRPARWHLLMACRHLALDGAALAPPNSSKIAKQMDSINKILGDDAKALKVFERAVRVFDLTLADSLDRDVLRGERPTERLRVALDQELGGSTGG